MVFVGGVCVSQVQGPAVYVCGSRWCCSAAMTLCGCVAVCVCVALSLWLCVCRFSERPGEGGGVHQGGQHSENGDPAHGQCPLCLPENHGGH